MKLRCITRRACLWTISAAALCSLTACFSGGGDKETYWEHAAHENTGSPTSGDIFGDWDMGTPSSPYGTHTWGVVSDKP